MKNKFAINELPAKLITGGVHMCSFFAGITLHLVSNMIAFKFT